MRVFFLFAGSFSAFIRPFSSTGFFGCPPFPFHPPFFFFLIFSRFAPLFLLRPLLLCPRSFSSLSRLRLPRPPALFAPFLSCALSLFLFPPRPLFAHPHSFRSRFNPLYFFCFVPPHLFSFFRLESHAPPTLLLSRRPVLSPPSPAAFRPRILFYIISFSYLFVLFWLVCFSSYL